ncbi:MAG: hypothetical protein J4428_00925 [Candidatus Aenigmarchaeota archaeon]|nr:hypothetical protein [Candidatus Aenigmarchaeota archaeon]
MRKVLAIINFVLLLSMGLVFAHEHNFNETKQLMDSGISCDKITNEQLEQIGEYLMEQMHPGEGHELMHQMMGMKEGTEIEEQFHIDMAKMMYCGETNSAMGGNMMNMMMGQNMMQGIGGYWSGLGILYLVLLVGLTILVYLGIIKLWKDMYQHKKK